MKVERVARVLVTVELALGEEPYTKDDWRALTNEHFTKRTPNGEEVQFIEWEEEEG